MYEYASLYMNIWCMNTHLRIWICDVWIRISVYEYVMCEYASPYMNMWCVNTHLRIWICDVWIRISVYEYVMYEYASPYMNMWCMNTHLRIWICDVYLGNNVIFVIVATFREHEDSTKPWGVYPSTITTAYVSLKSLTHSSVSLNHSRITTVWV